MVREAASPIERYRDNSSTMPQIFVRETGSPLKLWVSLLVPTRSTFCKMIEENGGKITGVHAAADWLVGDHMKDACAGEISYRWIEESIKQGELQNAESYKIVRTKPSVSRTHRRNEFSAEDDQILIQAVKHAESKGIGLSGNKLYDDLASLHPHHTSQSWRNRWVKTLSKRPELNSEPHSSTTIGSLPKVGFTREDDRLVLQAIQQPGADPEKEEFWDTFAAIHVANGHDAVQWRSRYMQRILPLLNQNPAEENETNQEMEVDDAPEHASGKAVTMKRAPTENTNMASKKPKLSTHNTEETTTPSKSSIARLHYQPTSVRSSQRTSSYAPPRSSSQGAQSQSNIPRSFSVPASQRRTSAPVPHQPRFSSLVPGDDSSTSLPARTLTYDNADRTLLFEDEDRRVTAFRTPSRNDDDQIIHSHLTNPPRREKVRVSLGNITIDIESSPHTPRVQPTFETGQRMLLDPGTGGRRRSRGEVPSTPGSSPVKFKSESLRDEEMPDIKEDETGNYDEDDYPNHIETDDLRQPKQNSGQEELSEMSDMEDDGNDVRAGLKDITMSEQRSQSTKNPGAFGPETQAMFEESEDLTLPNIEITPSPRKGRGWSEANDIAQDNEVRASEFYTGMVKWVKKKANAFSVDDEIVWWILERTGTRKKLTADALKQYAVNRKLPDMKGVWTQMEDDILTEGDAKQMKRLDKKHGRGAALDRKIFLTSWRKWSYESKWIGSD